MDFLSRASNWLHNKLYERIIVDEVISNETEIKKVKMAYVCPHSTQPSSVSWEDRYLARRVVKIKDDRGTIGIIEYFEHFPKEEYSNQASTVMQKLKEINVSPGTTIEVSRLPSLRESDWVIPHKEGGSMGKSTNVGGWYKKSE